MKTILAATNFSPSARNAASFAANLCKEVGARLVLFHTYHVQVPVSEGGVVTWTLQDTEDDIKRLLEKESEKLSGEFGIKVEYRFAPGFANEEIDSMQKELKADMVVMGIVHGSPLSDYLIGSTTVSFIRHSHAPVLVIPDKVVYNRPRRILFACDYDSRTSPQVLEPLKELAAIFNSKVFVLNVVKPDSEFNVNQSVAGIHLDAYLEAVNHIYYFPEEESVPEGIHHFTATHDIGWVAVVPHQHKWYERLLNLPNTKKVLFHADRPVLVLPDSLRK
ncbi:MAG: universal stress protein [Bacteroidia bacterium]|nr:universal stress protein [Bacteroidia bacterium]